MLYKRTSVTRHVSRVSSRLVSLVSSLVSSGHALSISSLLKLLSADCGQFTDLPGSLCVVLKNTGCAFLTSPLSYRVSCLSSGHLSLWLLLCSLLSALLCSTSNCSASAARLRSRIAALLGSQLCLAGSRLFLAPGSARLDVAAALLAALGSALLATARGTSARASRLLSACGSAWPV